MDSPYQSMPPKRMHKVRVRMNPVTRGLPMPIEDAGYVLDEVVAERDAARAQALAYAEDVKRLRAKLEIAHILVAYGSGSITEGQASKLLAEDRVTMRDWYMTILEDVTQGWQRYRAEHPVESTQFPQKAQTE